MTLKITEKLKPHYESIKKLYSLKNPIQFLDQLSTLLSTTEDNYVNLYNLKIDLSILIEYMEFRKFYVNLHKAKLSADLNVIHIETMDDSKRVHELTLETKDNKRKFFKVIDCDLPKFVDQSTFKMDNSLIVLYDKYKGVIDSLQGYFNLLGQIDGNCWILDPVDSNKKCNYRRIALGKRVDYVFLFVAAVAKNTLL